MRKQSPVRDYEVGHGRPPASTRFQKGESGNPKGRPKGRRISPPYDAALGQTVVINEGGVGRRVTISEMFLLNMAKRALAGDGGAAQVTMAAIKQARAARVQSGGELKGIIRVIVSPGAVNSAIRDLRLGVKLDRFRPTARMALEPWIVEAALERLGDKRFSVQEQSEIVRAVRTPHKVKWPDWWEIKPWE